MIDFAWLRFIFRVFAFLTFLLFPLFSACGFGQTEIPGNARSLPDTDAFLAGIKGNLKSDRLLLSRYTYNMQETVRYLDKEGRLKKTEARLYEVYPSLEEDMTYRRLISKNGEPLDSGKLEEQDRKYGKKADARARSLAKKRRSDQEQRSAKEAEAYQREREAVEDLFRLYDIVLLRREPIDGHSAILIQFTPKPQTRPQTKEGKILQKISGRALVSEADYQVMRVEVELIDDISIGLGLLARVHKDARLIFVRRKINNEIWLPAEFHFIGSARAFLFKPLRVESTSLFSDHRKFSATSSYEFLSNK